jgi:hypothetical protein
MLILKEVNGLRFVRKSQSGTKRNRRNWLSDMDSNHDKLLQRELCYHYTIGQTLRAKIRIVLRAATFSHPPTAVYLRMPRLQTHRPKRQKNRVQAS